MTGDAQGDVCAPQKFIQSFDPIHENANLQNRTLLNDVALVFRDPISGKQLSADHIRFADDVAEIHACYNAHQALHALRRSNLEFDNAVRP
eukprot:16437638-Heterocapsa_arctica.AAC.1